MNLDFQKESWEQYQWWQSQDRKTLRWINRILEDIDRNGNAGLGNPEPLTGELSGWWSRRIDDKHRLVYRIEGKTILVLQCKGHYGDR